MKTKYRKIPNGWIPLRWLACAGLALTLVAESRAAAPVSYRPKTMATDAAGTMTVVSGPLQTIRMETNVVITTKTGAAPVTNIVVVAKVIPNPDLIIRIETNTTITTSSDGGSVTNTTYTTNIFAKKQAPLLPPLVVEDNIVQFSAGLMLLSPYTTGTVTNSTATRTNINTVLKNKEGTKAQFYMDVAVNYTWAWNAGRRKRFVEGHDQEPSGTEVSHLDWFIGPDVDFNGHLTYIAKDDNETTAAAIVGTGQFGMEVSMGFPLYRVVFTKENAKEAAQAGTLFEKTSHAHWIGAVTSWSGTTDDSAFDIHSRYFVGLGYRAAFHAKVGDDPKEIVLSFQTGPAWVDAVRFRDGSHSRIIDDVVPGDPDYHSTFSWAWEAEMYIPLTKLITGVAGMRFNTGMQDAPNVWNAYVGVTIPLDKFFGSLLEK